MKGRDPVSGLPRQVDVTGEEMRQALEDPVAEIVAAVQDALETTPPELASDIFERGILVAGGGALLRGFAERLEQETNVPARLADDPLTAWRSGPAARWTRWSCSSAGTEGPECPSGR